MIPTFVKRNISGILMLVFLWALSASFGVQARDSLGSSGRKGYLEELEEAYVAKIARSRAERRIGAGGGVSCGGISGVSLAAL